MADFKTHISVGLGVCGIAATVLHAAGLITTQEVVWLTTLGTIGSLLPDIDSDHSIPVKMSFTVIALMVSLSITNLCLSHFPFLLVCLFGVAAYIGVRYGCFYAFTQLTRHRGMIHSLPCGLWFGLLCSSLFYQLQYPLIFAWLCGFFLTFGFLLHLLLDECYSVNLLGVSIKRSFGSAFKLFSVKYRLSSVFVYALLITTYYTLAPPVAPLWVFLQHPQTQQQIVNVFHVKTPPPP